MGCGQVVQILVFMIVVQVVDDPVWLPESGDGMVAEVARPWSRAVGGPEDGDVLAHPAPKGFEVDVASAVLAHAERLADPTKHWMHGQALVVNR